MHGRLLAMIVAAGCGLPLAAQTYTPKTIRLDGAPGMDQAALLKVVDLPPGAPVTKEQIDAAMHRLGDSGLFSEIRYTVNSDALVIVLKPAPGSQALPVRFANFVWWKPEELESMLQARVPLYRGKLPLSGQLTEQVEAALVALLSEKGIHNAQVSARLSTLNSKPDSPAADTAGIALALDQPQITLRKVSLTGTAPEVSAQMGNVLDRLANQDFDSLLTARQIVDNAVDTHRNGGYLDATVTDVFFSEPYPETVGFGIDGSAVVDPGARYRVASLSFDGVPPALQTAVAKASGIKSGDVAGDMALRIAEAASARDLQNRGMLDATAAMSLTRDTVAHTVACHIQLMPGPVYTLAGVDVSSLLPAQRLIFQRIFQGHPGAVADESLHDGILIALRTAGANGRRLREQKDPIAHTVRYVLEAPASAHVASGSEPR